MRVRGLQSREGGALMKQVVACSAHMERAEKTHAGFMARTDIKKVIVPESECSECSGAAHG